MPIGVAAVGAVMGGLAALLAIGLVLVYQAHRFLHFGHAAMGALSGAVVTYLVAHLGWHYWFAYAAGLTLGALLGVASGALLAERLAGASRVVVLMCSIGTAFAFGGAQVAVALATGQVLRTEPPIGVSLDLFPITFSGAHLLAVASVVAALGASWFLLRRTDVGLRIRALATAPVHARRMGIDPHRTWRVLWTFSGVLAAAAGIAAQPLIGTSFAAGPTLGPLLPALAAAVIGGMRNLPVTVVSAVVLGVAHEAVAWYVPIAATADLILLGVIVVALLVRRPERATRTDPQAWRFVRSIRPVDQRFHLSLRISQFTALAGIAIGALALVSRATSGDAQRIGTVAVFALAAIAVHVSATFGGRLSLGHWAIAGVATVVASQIGPASWLGALAAIASASALAVLLGAFSLRAGSLGYIAATFAVASAFPILRAHAQPAIGADTHFGPFDLTDPASTARAAIVAVALAVVVVGAFRRSRTGMNALAVREDPRLARVHGVAVVRTSLVVEAISGALAGLAGYCYLWSQGTVHPDAFGAARSLELVAMSALGGLGSVAGTVVGAVAVQGVQLFASGVLYLLGTGIGIFVVAVWLRGGLASLVDIVRTQRPRLRLPSLATSRPAPADRFADAAADASRKVRALPLVRRAGTTVALAAAVAGVLFAPLLTEHTPAAVAWLVIAAIVGAALGAGAGFRIPLGLPGAVALVAVAALTAALPIAAINAPVLAGIVLGSRLRDIADGTPSSLRSAASGWVGVQAAIGFAAGAALALVEPSPVLAVTVAVLAALAAAGRPARTDAVSARSAPDDGVHLEGVVVHMADEPLLRGIDIHIAPGRILGIAGANGSGKSTLLRAVAGEVRPTSGTITVAGYDATTSTPDELARNGVVLVEAVAGSNGELSVRDNMRIAGALVGDRRATHASVLATVVHPRLAASRDRAGVLSGGERRLLALSQALACAPRVLLADELGRGLAPEQLGVLAASLRELASRGTAVIVVEHDPWFLAQVTDDVVHLQRGRLLGSVS